MLIPATRYNDCEAALRFLSDVLELTEHAVYRDEDGRIMHAQMRLGSGLMMFGPPQGGAFDAFIVDPQAAQGETTTIYAVVEEVEALHDRIRERGADIVMSFESQGYGGSSFSVRDPEGHVWTFGDYDPKQAQTS